jgi:bidirectional [NiFe] hydrogenase diaphorase subunit
VSVKTLEIDGQMMTGAADDTIFDVAWEHGIHIPRLCHVGGLSDVGACRLCLVEVEGQKNLQASCLTTVEEGMIVRTSTPRLESHRKLIVELLLSERNHMCSVCVANGACELQSMAVKLGIDHVRLRYQFPQFTADTSHERFGLDHHRCILCTRCVRVCDEIEGAHTWDVSGRGIHSRIISDMGEPWGASESCTGCGKCVQVCPTGALFEKGKAVAEMRKDRSFLKYIVGARENKQWIG